MTIPVRPPAFGSEPFTPQTRRRAEGALVAAFAFLLAAAALAFVRRYAVDWFFNDDLNTLAWFARWDAGTLGIGDLADLWNNEHPVGTQFALMALMRAAFGLDVKAIVGLSFGLVAASAVLAVRCATDARQALGTRLGIVFACAVLAFHPTQMEHLPWAFELGWFFINAVVVADVLLAERLGRRALWPSAALCLLASFASAQGAFAWFAAGAHQALLPGPRLQRATCAIPLALGGILAVSRLALRPHLAAAHAEPGGPLAWVVYALEIVGGVSGSHRHGVLLATGSGLVALTLALFRLRRYTPDRSRLRAAAVMIGFSALCVAGFTQGRRALGIDWAVASFHAAPFLVPFLLGLVVLLAASPGAGRPSRADGAVSAALVAVLAAGVVAASGYGATRARLWAMDRGYARWATCRSALPTAVMARGSGVAYDMPGFEAALPLIRQMCGGTIGPLEAALVRRPALFDRLAAGRPDVGLALDALWEDYATDLMLQLAFKPWEPDMPLRLLAFAKANAAKGTELDPARLEPFADIYRGLSP